MIIKKRSPLLLLILIATLMSGCNDQNSVANDGLSFLETEVFYLQKINLPEGALLEVRLEDVSKMDVAAELISSATREIKSTPPYALQIAFPSDSIKDKHRYSLSASIKVNGKLHFISTTHINPFAVGIASPIEIKVDQVGG